MLCKEELESVAALAERNGFRSNVISIYYAFFQYEYLPDYDICVTYHVIEGEATFETDIERKEDMSPEELKTLCDAIGISLALIKHMGGITY